jgi:hypothetical protein
MYLCEDAVVWKWVNEVIELIKVLPVVKIALSKQVVMFAS